MRSYPIPFHEAARLDALAALDATGEPGGGPDPALDVVAGLARALLGAESALVSLVEAERQVFVARAGFPLAEPPRERSICAHMVAREAALVIEDARADPVFCDHPAVTGPPRVRFYAGAPIRLSSGLVVGGLCALGLRPRPAPSPEALIRLADLAELVAHVLEERAVRAGMGPALARAADQAQGEVLALVAHAARAARAGVLGGCQPTSRLVERLAGSAGPQAGRVAPREAEAAAGDLLGAVAAPLGPRLKAAGRRGPELRVEPTLRLWADADMLTLALESLATNALAHGAGAVRLVAARGAAGARLAVEDEGPGVAPEIREWALRPIAVNAPALAGAPRGPGLGLALARRLVELHAGELALEGGALVEEGRPFRAALLLPRWRVLG